MADNQQSQQSSQPIVRPVIRPIKISAPSGHSSGDHGRETLLLLLLAFVIHFVDAVYFNFNNAYWPIRFAMYSAIAIFGFFVYKDAFGNKEAFFTVSVVSLISFFMPLADWLFSKISLPLEIGFMGFMIFIAPWVWFILFNPNGSEAVRKIATFIIILLVILALAYVFVVFSRYADVSGLISSGKFEIKTALGIVTDFFINLGKGVYGAFTGISETVQKQINQSTAEYYSNGVEEKTNERLGVYFDNVKPLYNEYASQERAIIFASLFANTFTEKGFDIFARCYSKFEQSVYEDNTLKQVSVEIPGVIGTGGKEGWTEYKLPTGYDQLELDCYIPGNENEALGDYVDFTKTSYLPYIFEAEFEFQTWGYITYYFVDKNLFNLKSREARANGRTIAKELGIPEEPEAEFTNGPLKIGFRVRQQPIAVEEGETKLPLLFAITLDNNWRTKGRVVKIKEVVFQVPKPFELDVGKGACKDFVRANGPIEGDTRKADLQNYNYYKLANPVEIREKQDYYTVGCPILLSQGDIFGKGTVAGQGVAVPKTFVVQTDYEYLVEEQGSVPLIKEKPIQSTSEQNAGPVSVG